MCWVTTLFVFYTLWAKRTVICKAATTIVQITAVQKWPSCLITNIMKNRHRRLDNESVRRLLWTPPPPCSPDRLRRDFGSYCFKTWKRPNLSPWQQHWSFCSPRRWLWGRTVTRGLQPHPVTPPGFLMGAAEARATKLSNITDLTVCANVWLAVVLMMCIIYISGAVSL